MSAHPDTTLRRLCVDPRVSLGAPNVLAGGFQDHLVHVEGYHTISDAWLPRPRTKSLEMFWTVPMSLLGLTKTNRKTKKNARAPAEGAG